MCRCVCKLKFHVRFQMSNIDDRMPPPPQGFRHNFLYVLVRALFSMVYCNLRPDASFAPILVIVYRGLGDNYWQNYAHLKIRPCKTTSENQKLPVAFRRFSRGKLSDKSFKTAFATKWGSKSTPICMSCTKFSMMYVLYGTGYSGYSQILVSTPPFSRRWEHFSKIGLHGTTFIGIPRGTMEPDFWVASLKKSFFFP